MKGWFLLPVLMITGGLALYTTLPGNTFAAAAVFLGGVILLALLVWYVAEELRDDIEGLRDGVAGLFGRRPREVKVLELGEQLLLLRDAIVEASIASCELQRLQLAELKELAYHVSWIDALFGEMLDEGCFVKPIDTDIAMAEASRNSDTALSHAVQKSLEEREQGEVLAFSPAGLAFSEWLEKLEAAGFPHRYAGMLMRAALFCTDHCHPSLPSEPDGVWPWLERVAVGEVAVRNFGEKKEAALRQALGILKRERGDRDLHEDGSTQ